MNTVNKVSSVPFVFDFEPEFDYDISIADYVPRYDTSNPFLRKPLTIGDSVPAFELSRTDGVWQQLPVHLRNSDSISLYELVDHKPLVISFYSPDWGQYAQHQLELLEKSHQKITGLGGQLLVLTSVAPAEIPSLVEKYKLDFNLIHDTDNRIAELLGAYSKVHPLWQLVAGIDADVPYAATFAIAQNGIVVYDFVSQELDRLFQVRDLLTAIYSVRDVRQSA